MAILHHYPFCPNSRFVRIVLAEIGLEPELKEERPWERRIEYLGLNPAGSTPTLVDGEVVAPGAAVIGRRLLPKEPAARVEVRRLLDWFLGKFQEEVTGHLVTEKIFKRFMGQQSGPPDMNAIRAARTNLRYHLQYIGYLIAGRNWLAGDDLTYADLAAAAHLSCADYLGDVPWDEDETAKDWYARVKSRPAFRAVLADRVPGMTPASHYADLDF